MKSFNQNRNETETRTEKITENAQSFFYRWVKFCFLLRQMGKSYKGKERFLCLVSPYWHTMTGTNGSINITPIEKIVKSSGKVAGFTSVRPKMRVMSCKCPFRKVGDMKKRIFGNLWFCGCSVTLLQVVMGSQWQHGAICHHEMNDTKAAPKGVGGRTLTCRRGQINIQIIPVLWVVKTFFFPLTVQKWFTRKTPLCKNGRLCVSTVQKMSGTYLPSFSNFLLKIFVFLLSNPCNSLPKIKVPDGEYEFHKCQDDFTVWN